MEKTLVLIKPDGVERNLIGNIIARYERENLKIISLKLIVADRDKTSNHYKDHEGKSFYEGLINSFLDKKIVAMVLEGNDAIAKVREINGATDPSKAEKGTIRGDFGQELPNNTVHASDSEESFLREEKIWFS